MNYIQILVCLIWCFVCYFLNSYVFLYLFLKEYNFFGDFVKDEIIFKGIESTKNSRVIVSIFISPVAFLCPDGKGITISFIISFVVITIIEFIYIKKHL